MNKNKSTSSTARINHYKIIMIIIYSLIIAASLGMVSVLTFRETDAVLKQKVLQMSAQLNMQMQINLDSYLERIETLGTLAFSNPLCYQYDDTDTHTDDYDAIKARSAITDHLYNICLTENFVDFGIVYSNNQFTGKISNGSLNVFGDDMYSDLKSMISNPRTSDGWFIGFDGNYRRIYYVKVIHENALLVTSFYSSELENVFEHSKNEGLESLSIRLVEHDDIVIYSNDSEETGVKLEYDLLSRIDNSDLNNSSMIDEEYLISVNECSAGWRVVCSMPTAKILMEKNDVQRTILLIALFVLLLTIIITALTFDKVMTPVNTIVSTLDDEAHTDLLTGILNKRSFENFTENSIAKSDKSNKNALILLDLDNFKGVNDNLGHEYGDKVLAGVGDILRKVFPEENDLLGRLGGDEFCVFIHTEKKNPTEYTEQKCRELCHAFSENYTGDDNSYKISASIGVSFFPDDGMSFPELYRRADKALYSSKHRGKDTYTIYNKAMEEDK